MPIELRAIAPEEHAEFAVVEATAFGFIPEDDKHLEEDRSVFEYDRTIAGFDDGRIVATACAFTFDMTVPGGATVPVAGVSAVSVSATHRRQGILRRMMAMQLDDVAARGEPIAILNASESSIYGRFGYGLAQLFQSWRIDTLRSAFVTPVRDDLVLRIVPQGDARPLITPIHDAWRRTRPGALTQTDAWWQCVLSRTEDWRGGGKLFVVVCEPTEGPDGHGGGYALYKVDGDHPAGHWKLDVRELVALDDDVEAKLWRYLLDVDLVDTVTVLARPMDDPLRWRLADPRQLHTTDVRDYLFVRLLDLPAAFAARRYERDGTLVLAVTDPFRPATSGTYVLEARDGAGTCTRVEDAREPDLTLDIADLGSLFLGGFTASELAHAGRITARDQAALAAADAILSWPVAPFCPTRF